MGEKTFCYLFDFINSEQCLLREIASTVLSADFFNSIGKYRDTTMERSSLRREASAQSSLRPPSV